MPAPPRDEEVVGGVKPLAEVENGLPAGEVMPGMAPVVPVVPV